MSYTIEKIDDTRVKKITPITARFTEEETSLDEVNSNIATLDTQIENYNLNIEAVLSEVDKLKVKKEELLILKQAIEAAGGKTRVEVREIELQKSLDAQEIV